MNTRHLGDANDLAKKDILKTLKAELKKEVYVLPMFTDEFNEVQLSFYINWTSADGINNVVIGPNTRENYFRDLNIKNYGIIFIDPDIGITFNGWPWTHVSTNEISSVLTDNNLVVVYDQAISNTENTRDRLNSINRAISVPCFYLDAQACFAFISRDKNLLEKAKTCLLREQVIYPERLVELNENETQPN